MFSKSQVTLHPSDIIQFAEFTLIPEKAIDLFLKTHPNYEMKDVEEIQGFQDGLQINVTINGEDICLGYIWYDMVKNSFWVNEGEIGGGPGTESEATFCEVLDVDEASRSPLGYIKSYGPYAYPEIKDSYSIETIIVPNKSCRVKCKNVFTFGNTFIETEEFETYTTVPIYYTEGVHEPMIREIAEMEQPSIIEIQKIKEKYFYHPENFKIYTPAEAN